MKNWLYALGFVVLVVGGYVAGVHLSGGAWYDFGIPLGGDAGELRRTTRSFWEDIQFKDFDSASRYHAPDKQSTVDIPFILERVFVQKPELLEIMEFEVILADIDTSGLRARTKTRVRVKDLVRQKVRDQEVLLFFHRESIDAPWFMELESSLREGKGEEGKQH